MGATASFSPNLIDKAPNFEIHFSGSRLPSARQSSCAQNDVEALIILEFKDGRTPEVSGAEGGQKAQLPVLETALAPLLVHQNDH
jgi:hypothetical protein